MPVDAGELPVRTVADGICFSTFTCLELRSTDLTACPETQGRCLATTRTTRSQFGFRISHFYALVAVSMLHMTNLLPLTGKT